jgi:integrase
MTVARQEHGSYTDPTAWGSPVAHHFDRSSGLVEATPWQAACSRLELPEAQQHWLASTQATPRLPRLLGTRSAGGIAKISSAEKPGVRTEVWLTRDEARTVFLRPDISTLKSKRDRAILAVLLGCALRRSELVALEVHQLEQRENRWVIVDFRRKGGRKRTVPVLAWVKNAIDDWTAAAEITEGPIFRSIGKGGRLKDETLAEVGFVQILDRFEAQQDGEFLRPHPWACSITL